jgi:TRAP-type uncharacterized transport system fused permease subunit
VAAYIVPFVFIYNPAILWAGSWYDILRALAMSLAAGYAFAGATNSNYGAPARVLMFCAAIAMLAPVILANVAGVALVVAVLVLRGASRLIGRRQR